MPTLLLIHRPEELYECTLSQEKEQDNQIHSFLEEYYILREQALKRLTKLYPTLNILSQSYMDASLRSSKENDQSRHLKKNPKIRALGSQKKKLSIAEFLQRALQESADSENTFLLCYGWYPFLDESLTKEITEYHSRFQAHITYGENIPFGFIPDLINREYLAALASHQVEEIRSFTFTNIDKFDVEIFYKRPELRHYRLDFSTQTHRSCKIVSQIIDIDFSLNYQNLEKFISQYPDVFRLYPSYITVEVTNRNKLKPFYLPQSKRKVQDLRDDLLEKLVKDIKLNGLLQDTTVAFAGLGDPSEMPNLFHWLEQFLVLPQVKKIYLETYGYNINQEFLLQADQLPQAKKIEIIIALSSLQKDRYQKFYAADMLEQIFMNLKECALFLQKKKSNLSKIYVEMIRIQENDDEVDSFMKFFQYNLIAEDFQKVKNWQGIIGNHVKQLNPMNYQKVLTPILKKPNNYLGKVPDRKVVELSPVIRSFCWHLQRDVYLTCEGKVPVCMQDPFAIGQFSLDFAQHSIPKIQEKHSEIYAIDQRGDYKKNKIACEKCDEWYTFNG